MRNVELATTTNITTTYSGQASSDYIAAALFSATTIDEVNKVVAANMIDDPEFIRELLLFHDFSDCFSNKFELF